MKKVSLFVVAAVAMSVFATSCDSKKSVSLKKDVDSVSYAIGILNGDGFNKSLEGMPGEPINKDILLAAFETSFKGDTSAYKMTAEEAQAYMQKYFTDLQEKESKAAREEGENFLAENKTKPGVITTESGLQYKVETEGTGAKPGPTDKVKVHYTGMLLDGTVFDSSIERGEPTTLSLNGVIKGWQEGLQIMPVGSKYTFWIPWDLAYGERGAGQQIKGYSALKFEVELLGIEE
ncbi:FKBP-type peptidyl-prolyl cis-trans isomerase [Parabacteroides sp. OttesenSCG-928-N08]|nr:FKBP-type peptidyl-prolyl cis-trans isomerase [Parabacteroides sp. OttesenSCG-928-N08]